MSSACATLNVIRALPLGDFSMLDKRTEDVRFRDDADEQSFSTTGMPPILCSDIACAATSMGASGEVVIG